MSLRKLAQDAAKDTYYTTGDNTEHFARLEAQQWIRDHSEKMAVLLCDMAPHVRHSTGCRALGKGQPACTCGADDVLARFDALDAKAGEGA